MELDTPLAFSESWSVTPNTFEAAVLINEDIADTTLVAAYIGKGNGNDATGSNAGGPVGWDYMAADADFNTFLDQGAYAVGAVNNSFKPLTAQAWYYNVASIADAYWLQADLACEKIPGLVAGVQYGAMNTKGLFAGSDDSSAYAFKLGYETDTFTVSAAYSDTDEDGTLYMGNVATGGTGYGQSKLYTEAWWAYGVVGAAGIEAYNVTATYSAEGIADFGVYYTDADGDAAGDGVTDTTLEVARSFGPLDVGLYYIMIDAEAAGSDYDSIQAYLTYNF
jgi:hypothetical protein